MDTSQVITQLGTIVIPGVITGLIILLVEYMTPWFAHRRSSRKRDLLPDDQNWIENFQGNFVKDEKIRKLHPSILSNIKTNQIVISELECEGESHFILTIKFLRGNQYNALWFRVHCTRKGEVVSIDKISPRFNLSSFIFFVSFWAIGEGVCIFLLQVANNYAQLYQQVGLNILDQNTLLVVIIILQLALLPATLFSYPLYAFAKSKDIKFDVKIPFLTSLSTWLQCTIALGIYPLNTQKYIDSLVFWRTIFQHTFLLYKMSGDSQLIWASDISLLVFAGLLTILVTVIITSMGSRLSWLSYLILLIINLFFYVSSYTILGINAAIPVFLQILKWAFILGVGGSVLGIITYFIIEYLVPKLKSLVPIFRKTATVKPTAAMRARDITNQTELTDYEAMGEEPPTSQFVTTYVIGDDLFDDSFSIDLPSGEFVGECGIGISETIGVSDPKKVSAFEIWLFDKNDIQTITNVLTSEHAINDPATRQRLEAKGELFMAGPGKQLVLETATLQLVATVSDMEYGQGALPVDSYFERLTLEIAVWPKVIVPE